MDGGGSDKVTKRILCLVIHSLQAGGMERVMSELARHFALKEELDLHLIIYGMNREIFYEIPGNITIHKPIFRFNNRFRLYFTIRTLFFLRSAITGIRPESVLSFGEYWNSLVLLSTRGLKVPVFVSDRSQPDKSLGTFQDKLRQWLYPCASGVILQTEKAKEIYLRKNRSRNIAVIGNPIREISEGTAPVEREKAVLMVGRLIRSKHQDQLIEMFSRVAPPDWKLVLVGYDHLGQNNLERLRKLARELQVEESVVFAGKQDQIEKIYLRSAIFAFTSSSEGFPNVIGEAMSAGLPVIAYDCTAGPSEMIVDGFNGYLVPLFDTDDFESKLARLMAEEELRNSMGSNGRESIKRFSREQVCDSFYRFIMTRQNNLTT